nr:pre-mRNA-splicing factor ATP-dependent RNA helicase DEAH7 [Tanacetum cinerariifolium]
MAIISRNGSNLVREVHEKQSMNKSRQRFWELAGSKLGNILGVEKSAEQYLVKMVKFISIQQHLTKGEADKWRWSLGLAMPEADHSSSKRVSVIQVKEKASPKVVGLALNSSICNATLSPEI